MLNIGGADVSLGEFMRANNVKFNGYYGEDRELGQVLMLYARLPQNLGGLSHG